jgi:hypothetical protein
MNTEPAVPKEYHSEYTGEPFVDCLICERPLDGTTPFVVEKHIRRGEAVLEMALCDPCCENMVDRNYSHESLERELELIVEWMNAADTDVEHCTGCQKPRDHADGYLLAAGFHRGHIPMVELALCMTCIDTLAAVRSRKTRENFGKFIETYFPGVPEYADAPVLLV